MICKNDNLWIHGEKRICQAEQNEWTDKDTFEMSPLDRSHHGRMFAYVLRNEEY